MFKQQRTSKNFKLSKTSKNFELSKHIQNWAVRRKLQMKRFSPNIKYTTIKIYNILYNRQ